MKNSAIQLSIIIPALNEEKTIGITLKKATEALDRMGLNLSSEIIVVDNGSSDRTAIIAKDLGARVLHITQRGYGNALMKGFSEAKGEYLIMADADDSYDLGEIGPFLEKLKEGYDLVMGNRFKGHIEKGAMPFLHRYIGNPFLTWLANLFFKTGIGDAHCGMRGLSKSGFIKMKLKAGGMELATEMVIKASILKLKITEIPCNYHRDKRNKRPHLRTWQDGWRHLRFMMLFTSTWTFLIPGLVITCVGFSGMAFIFLRDIFKPEFMFLIVQKHILAFMLVFLMGCQVIQLGLIAKAFSFSRRFDYASKTMKLLNKHFRLERGIAFGLILILLSSSALLYLPISFFTSLLPRLSDLIRLDIAIFAISFFMLGIQFIFSSFVLSLFYLKVK